MPLGYYRRTQEVSQTLSQKWPFTKGFLFTKWIWRNLGLMLIWIRLPIILTGNSSSWSSLVFQHSEPWANFLNLNFLSRFLWISEVHLLFRLHRVKASPQIWVIVFALSHPPHLLSEQNFYPCIRTLAAWITAQPEKLQRFMNLARFLIRFRTHECL